MLFLLIAACSSEPAATDNTDATGPEAAAPAATTAPPAGPFTFGWSEYPSWSAFWAMHKAGTLDGDQGELGTFELQYNVDIVLVEGTYDDCIAKYASGQLDIVALTNLDTLTTGVRSVAFLPTSTSFGGDQAWTSTKITDLAGLKGKKVHGLAGSVSEYMFRRNVEIVGLKQADFIWVGETPEAVTQAIMGHNERFGAGVVWNPYGIAIRKERKDMHALVTSRAIGGEIVDMLVMSETSWAKPGAQAAAQALAAAFYDFNDRLQGIQRDELLIAAGEKFGASTVEDMNIAVVETKFYGSPAEGQAVWSGSKLRDTMPRMVSFVMAGGVVTTEPVVAYGAAPANIPDTQAYLRFDNSVMEAL